ncbi:transposase [Legionella pneumophila serogroup 9]
MHKQPEYSPEICGKLLSLFNDGSSVVEVCQALGISQKTYQKWKVDHSEFGEAADFAEEAAEAKYLKLSRLALFSNGKIKVDTALYSYVMKNQYGYRAANENLTLSEAEIGQPLSISFSVVPAVGEITVTNAKTTTSCIKQEINREKNEI